MRVKARINVHEPLTQERFDRAIKEGEEKTKNDGYAKSIKLIENTRELVIYFSDNTSISFPANNYSEFSDIPNEDLKLAEIGFAGTAICLEKYDLHVSISGLIADSPSLSRVSNNPSVHRTMRDEILALKNIRTLRSQAREKDLKTLENMLENLSTIVKDRREEEAVLHKEQEKRQAKLEAYREKLLEAGIDPAELLSGLSKPSKSNVKSQRPPRVAKYKYIDENGNEQTWTGQGRTPKAIALAITAGKKLKDFAV